MRLMILVTALALLAFAAPASASLLMTLDSTSQLSLEGCEKSHVIEISASVSSPEGLELHNGYLTLGGETMLDADCTEVGGSIECSARIPPTPGCTRDSTHTYSDNSLSVVVSYPDSKGLINVEELYVPIPDIEVSQGFLTLDSIMEEGSARMEQNLESMGLIITDIEEAILECEELVTRLMAKVVTISLVYAEKGWVPTTYGHAIGAINYADTFAEKYALKEEFDEAGAEVIDDVSAITNDVCDVIENRHRIESAGISLQSIYIDMDDCLSVQQEVIDSGGHINRETEWFTSVRDCLLDNTNLVSAEISNNDLDNLMEEADAGESGMMSGLSIFTKGFLNISEISSLGALKIYCDGSIANGGLCCERSDYSGQAYSSISDCTETKSSIIYMPGGCPEESLAFGVKGPNEEDYHSRDLSLFAEEFSASELFREHGSLGPTEGIYSFVLYCDDGDGTFGESDRMISMTEIEFMRPSCVSSSSNDNCIDAVSAEDDCKCSYKGSLFFGNGANMKLEDAMIGPMANRDYELKASKRFYRDSSAEPRCTKLGDTEIQMMSDKSCQLYAGETIPEDAVVHTLSPPIKTCSRDGYYAYFLYGNPKVMGTGSNCIDQRVFVNDKGFVHIANLKLLTEEELAGYIDFDELYEMYGTGVETSSLSYQGEDLSDVYSRIREIYSQYTVTTMQFDNFYFCKGTELNENCGRVPDSVADGFDHVLMDVMSYYTATGFMPATKDGQIADNLIVTFYTEQMFFSGGYQTAGKPRMIGTVYPLGI